MDTHIVTAASPQWDWPSDRELGIRFLKWQAEFKRLHNHPPNVPEMLEWAYQEGLKDGKGST